MTSTSTLNIDEPPVTCGEPARRTDNIDQSYKARARDGVWDNNVVVNFGNDVRFYLRESEVLGVWESRVGESAVLSAIRMKSGLNQSMSYPVCIA